MSCEITIFIHMQKIRSFPAVSQKLWPNVRYADTLLTQPIQVGINFFNQYGQSLTVKLSLCFVEAFYCDIHWMWKSYSLTLNSQISVGFMHVFDSKISASFWTLERIYRQASKFCHLTDCEPNLSYFFTLFTYWVSLDWRLVVYIINKYWCKMTTSRI